VRLPAPPSRALARRAAVRCVTAALLVMAAALPADARRQADGRLDAVDAAIASGRFTEARTLLDAWNRQFGDAAAGAPAAERARGLYLRARLTTNPQQAVDAYLAVVLAHPSAAVAPLALLRLSQGLLATGDAGRAIGYLERLSNDYPGTDARADGQLWLVRAYAAAGRSDAACAAFRRAEQAAAGDATLLDRLQAESSACANPAAAAPVAAATATAAARTPPAAATGRFAVQIGAFRDRAGAERAAADARTRGFDSRIITTPENSLFRVRVGRFESAALAAAETARILAAGLTAIVVSDADRER
jgi:cell division septation protein DedD